VNTRKCTPVFRDVVTIQQDDASAGDEGPTYSDRVAGVPCSITQISGDETWRSRRLTERVDFVIQCWHSETLAQTKATDRVLVTGGVFVGKTLNVVFPRIDQTRPLIMELFCREDVAA